MLYQLIRCLQLVATSIYIYADTTISWAGETATRHAYHRNLYTKILWLERGLNVNACLVAVSPAHEICMYLGKINTLSLIYEALVCLAHYVMFVPKRAS